MFYICLLSISLLPYILFSLVRAFCVRGFTNWRFIYEAGVREAG